MSPAGWLALAAATAVFVALACRERWHATRDLRWDNRYDLATGAAVGLTIAATFVAALEVAL